jgi:AcrR family transcriptional regulator
MSPRKEPEAKQGDPLPRGRHKLPREAVRASQRARLLSATAKLVGEQGYDATSVQQIVSAARVSASTFYRFFGDKADCFIALCEQQGEELFAELSSISAAGDTLEDALVALDRGIRLYLQWWQDRPRLARAYFLELPLAGPRALEERDRQYARFEALHRFTAERARVLRPDTPPLRDVDVTAATIVITELVARHVRAGQVERLDEIEDDVRYLLIRMLVDDHTARQVSSVRRAGTGPRPRRTSRASRKRSRP